MQYRETICPSIQNQIQSESKWWEFWK
jgi:hypothetical protein